MRRIVSSLILALFFMSLFAFAFNVQTARAQSVTIYINPNGSISPTTANITTPDNITYTFTGNNYLPIVVNRSNIIIDGNAHTLEAPGEKGFSLSGMSDVTIKNITIINDEYGIYLISSSGNVLSGNNVTANSMYGIELGSSCDNNTLSDNNITANVGTGILLVSSCDNNTLSDNNITANGYDGIWVDGSCDNNTLSGNNVTANSNDGIDLYSSSGDVLSGNKVAANGYDGVYLTFSYNNTLSGNNITANSVGIDLESSCDNNTLSGNNVTANSFYGIYLYSSSSNRIFNNDFSNNTQQTSVSSSTNTWDDGYPSGGNYWSDYRTTYPNAVENDSSAIWNASYVIGSNNTDRYPLMGPFHTFDVTSWNGTAYMVYSVDTVCNSTITNLSFNSPRQMNPIGVPSPRILSFNVTGTSGTMGFCRVTIPLSLMSGEWTVTVNGTQPRNLNITTYGNYTYVYFTYHHSTETVKITSTNAVPEFSSFLILPLFMIATLLAVAIYKKRPPYSFLMKRPLFKSMYLA
jgi:parallel beta-helix repeat protein